MPVSKLLKLPIGSYLMVRLDFIIITGDELEAKILRIIEMYMEDERRLLYRNLLNDPQNAIDPNEEIDVTRDVWIAISYRLFKNDLYDQEMSDNTLKRALKSLKAKKFIRAIEASGKRYEAPKYQINIEVVQEQLNLLGTIKKTEYQKLMVSKIDTIKNSPHQVLTPSGYQKLIPSGPSRVSKIDTNSRKVRTVEKEVEKITPCDEKSSQGTPAFSFEPSIPEDPITPALPLPIAEGTTTGTTIVSVHGNLTRAAFRTLGTSKTSIPHPIRLVPPDQCPQTDSHLDYKKASDGDQSPQAEGEEQAAAGTLENTMVSAAPTVRRARKASTAKGDAPPKPPKPKVSEKEVEEYLTLFDRLGKETGAFPNGYGHTGVDHDAVRMLLKNNLRDPEFVTPRKAEVIYRYMVKLPPDPRTGYSWKDHGMSIKSYCNHYADMLKSFTDEARKKQEEKQKKAPMSLEEYARQKGIVAQPAQPKMKVVRL